MRICLSVLLFWLVACDETRPRFDPDPQGDATATLDGGALDGAASADGAPPDAARLDDAGAPTGDATATDDGVADSALPDARPADAAPLDAAPPVDGAFVDATVIDAGAVDASAVDAGAVDGGAGFDAALPDARTVDAAFADLGPAPDLGVEAGFVIGHARAADEALAVRVTGGGAETRTDPDGRFRLGPLPPGPVELVFSAPEHQSLTRAIAVEADLDVALADEVLLYRGRRIGAAASSQLRFTFDGAWVIWSVDDRLMARPTTPDGEAVELLARDFEVFIGFVPGQPAIAVRRRVQAGIAGDIDVIQLADGARTPLFVEAQPWVRWRGDAALGMVGTRDGLSTLVLGAPGDAPAVLGEGVPWLLVTQLADGEPVWAQASDDAFMIWRGGDAIAAAPLAPDAPASDDFLLTTPGRTGLLWRDPTGDLIRWEPETGAVTVAEDVLASPRPRFVPQGLVFWRDDPAEPGLQELHLLADDGPRRIIGAVDGNSLRLAGARYYLLRPEDGLWTGTLVGEAPARLLAGDRIQFATQGQGVIALVDGSAWWAIPGGQRLDAEVDGLSTLQGLAVGATAWQAATRTLWWIPGPDQAAPPAPLVADAPRARRTAEPGNAAVFALGPDGYLRAPIPPGMAQTIFAVIATELAVLSARQVLGWQADGWLYAIDPADGSAIGWAGVVSRVVTSNDRRFVAYVSDRGTFLVDRGP